MAAAKPSVLVDVTSDTVCPWCYVGKKNIERAIEEVKDKYDVQVGALSCESNKDMWTAGGGKEMILSEDSTSGYVEQCVLQTSWLGDQTDYGTR